MKTNAIITAIAADLNNTHLADGKHSQLVRDLLNETVRQTSDGRRYIMPSGRLAKSSDKCIAAWREAAKA